MDATVIEYRWLSGNEILSLVNPACAARGWAELNVNDAQPTCRVLGAWSGERLVGWFAFQMYPLLGPMFVEPEVRNGKVSAVLAERMYDFLIESEARGYLVVCESPVSEVLARKFDMHKLAVPVYTATGGGV